MYPSKIADRVQVRLPDGLRAIIKEKAASARRSMNAEIVHQLEKSYATLQSGAAGDQVGTATPAAT